MEISTRAISIAFAAVIVLRLYGGAAAGGFSKRHAHLQKIQSAIQLKRAPPPPSPATPTHAARVYHATSYGADPTGKSDSTDAILAAMSDALKGPATGIMMAGIDNLGGARVDLDGGNYLVSRPIRFPATGKGNLVIHGGSLTASNNFPTDGYLIDLSPPPSSAAAAGGLPEYNYEFVTLRDLFLDSNLRGGGIRAVDSLRTSVDNCYLTGFNTTGIMVTRGHETYIRNSYLGQHITAGAHPSERQFSGTAIELVGNDNAVTDVVIFSAATGIVVSGQANTVSGVHCYNKATGFGGVGVYLRLPGLTQTRIVNSYFDYTGVVAEDPVQLTITNSFFLGDAFVLLKSVEGVANGVNIVDNMFSGSDKGVEIVQLDGKFDRVDQVVVDRNSVHGMRMKATVARGGVRGEGMTWTADFNSVLVFPNMIRQVQYSFFVTNESSSSFPVHVLRGVSGNRVVVEAHAPVEAVVYVTVDQGGSFLST